MLSSPVSRLSLLVDLASLLAREVDLDALLRTACERMARALDADRATIWLVDAEARALVATVALMPELLSLRLPIGRGLAGVVAETGEPVRIDDVSRDPRFDASVDRQTGYVTRSMLVVPIREGPAAPVRGVVQLLNRREGPFDDDDQRYLEALAVQLARALSLTTLRAPEGDAPGLVLQGPFNRIVGRSPSLAAVYARIQRAAETDATVLLRGETGTGKGLFARAIHVNSPRQAKPFVVVDCTTLPAQLVESELFGHERGAFTGADRRVPGKVELAEGGTLFIDELGDLPPDIQGKLLRFLQERTFERVGGRQTLRADVRVVAATHVALERGVEEGRFRRDLYYRVRVVEIELPRLVDRGGDEIEALARHFADLYAARYARPSPRLSDGAIAALRAHTFPGNVRELEHWIEAAIALAPDGLVLAEHLPRPRLGREGPPHEPPRPEPTPREPAPPTAPASLASSGSSGSSGSSTSRAGSLELTLDRPLAEVERRYARAVLDDAGGNKSEAARRLGISRNTLGRLLD